MRTLGLTIAFLQTNYYIDNKEHLTIEDSRNVAAPRIGVMSDVKGIKEYGNWLGNTAGVRV